ncbi:unnamed protein product [Rotaria socialis]|uniref:Uncharacterized protein n=1 Tax=Rotaria socialis TaxID=392032 RepID=A0A821X5A6_9BILA|nr:unnamed protein product [Rotaria socialis]
MGIRINKFNEHSNDDDDDGYSDTNYGKNKRRFSSSEDWTHVDDQHTTIEINDEPRQALSRLATIAKRAAIIAVNNNEAENRPLSLFNESEFRQICVNNCLRESFVNLFAQLFSQMDAFICDPPSGKYSNVDQWLAQRCPTKNFERTMFIADQPKRHVPSFYLHLWKRSRLLIVKLLQDLMIIIFLL